MKKASNLRRWARGHDARVKKHWNWRMIEAKDDNAKLMSTRCVPFALNKWKAFGFDGKHQPMWAINDYMNEWHEYADQRLQGD
jgi:hypothetical protein